MRRLGFHSGGNQLNSLNGDSGVDLEKLITLLSRVSASPLTCEKSVMDDLKQGLAALKNELAPLSDQRARLALQAFEFAPVGCVFIDSKGQIVDANETFAELVGHSLKNLPRRQFADFIAPESKDGFFRRCVVLFSGLSPEAPCELKMLDSEGERFYASLKGFPISTASNGRLCLLYVRDVNAERGVALALTESERRFRMLFEQNPLGYLSLNSAGYVAEANEAASKMFKLSRETLIGRHIGALAAPSSEDALASMMAELRRNGHLCGQVEMELIRSGEGAFTASISGNVGVDSHELFTQTHLIIADISSNKKADSERKLLATAVDQAAEGVLIIGVKGNILYANPSFEKISGAGRGSLIGRDFVELLSNPPEGALFYAKLAQAIAASGQPWSGRLRGARLDGSAYEMELVVSAVKDSDGAISNHVAVCQDITSKLRMERELRQSQKMQAIGTLAGGIAHDFNNILMAMMGYTEMAIETLGENQRAKVFLNQVLTSSRRAKDLIKQILTFSRQTERSLRPLQAGLVVKEALKLLRSTLPSTIKMKSSIKSHGLCLADLTELHQVVMNLCTNAAYAMNEKGGVLEVSMEDRALDRAKASAISPELKAGKYIVLSVADTGAGIPHDIMERIFEPFFTTKPAGEGTGMGLSVVHGIIKELGGHVEVESILGKGSVFRVFVPLVDGVGEDAEEPNAQKLLGEGQVVLCVDDEPAIVELIASMLRTLNYKPVVANSSAEALALVAKDAAAFDAVITDHTMPDMTGLILSREILKLRHDLPVLLCTGFNGAMLKGEYADSGVRDVLFKPVGISDLGLALRKYLAQDTAIVGR